MALIIVISTEDFQIGWNVMSLFFSERETGKWPLGQSDSYHNYLISNDCIQHSAKLSICNTYLKKPLNFLDDPTTAPHKPSTASLSRRHFLVRLGSSRILLPFAKKDL